MKKTSLLLIVFIPIALGGCGGGEQDALEAKIEELRQEVEHLEAENETLKQKKDEESEEVHEISVEMENLQTENKVHKAKAKELQEKVERLHAENQAIKWLIAMGVGDYATLDRLASTPFLSDEGILSDYEFKKVFKDVRMNREPFEKGQITEMIRFLLKFVNEVKVYKLHEWKKINDGLAEKEIERTFSALSVGDEDIVVTMSRLTLFLRQDGDDLKIVAMFD